MKAVHTPFQKGFTLVEIMIALTIGLFLAAGVTQVFISTKGTNRVQENLSRMQENARFAMHFISTDIRKAGFLGGICGDREVINDAVNRIDSSGAEYIFQSSASNPAVSGVDGTGVNGSDQISINALSFSGVGIPLVAPLPTAVTDSLYVDASAGIAQGSIILVTDCKYQDIFQVTNDPTATGELQHNIGGAVVPSNDTNILSNIYDTAGVRVYVISALAGGVPAITYGIADDVNGVPGLTQGAPGGPNSQLIANIENMQVSYGQRLGGGETYYVPAGTAGLDMERVISVRISLLARSPDDFVTTNPQTYFYKINGASSSVVATDNRLRKAYTSTLTLRNRLN